MPLHYLLIGISLLFLMGVRQAADYMTATEESAIKEPRLWQVYLAFFLMLLIRIMLSFSITGYGPDVQTFQAWAIQTAKDLTGFYSSGIFADYPPGYMYALFLIGKLKEVWMLGNASPAFLALTKLPAIFADMAMVLLLYRLADGLKGKKTAFALALLYGFNPAIIINSAVWGQVDAVFTLFIALSVICLAKEWLIRSMLAFTLALLIKPQALIFTPLLLCAIVDRLLFQSFTLNWKRVLASAAAGMAVFVVAILPFAVREGALWIFRLYGGTLGSYPYATLNAFNLFAVSGGNFIPETDSWLFFSYKSWGGFFIVAATLFSGWVYFFGKKEVRSYHMALFLIAAVFMLSSKMHERYLFPVLIFTLLASLYAEDRKMLALFACYSVTHFMNVAQVLVSSMHGIYHVPRFNPLLIAISITNLLLFCFTIRLILREYRSQREKPGNGRLSARHD